MVTMKARLTPTDSPPWVEFTITRDDGSVLGSIDYETAVAFAEYPDLLRADIADVRADIFARADLTQCAEPGCRGISLEGDGGRCVQCGGEDK